MSSRNCALLDRTDIIGRSGFRGAYWWAISKRSADLGVAPKEIAAAVALMRSGRTDLITEVMNKRLTVARGAGMKEQQDELADLARQIAADREGCP